MAAVQKYMEEAYKLSNKQMIKCRKEAQTFEYWKNWFFKTLLRENFKMCNLKQK